MCDLYVCPLDENDKSYAENQLNETEETRGESLRNLVRWLREEVPDLRARDDTRHLLAFLRGCKFGLKKTKEKLVNYYAMRRDEPVWFANRDPDLRELQELMRLGVFVPLRESNVGKLVVIIRVGAYDPRKQKQDDVFKIGNMLLDLATKDNEKSQIYGITAILDMSAVTYWHARAMSPSYVRRVVSSWKNYHCRPKQFEFVNSPVYIAVVLDIFKRFMGKKMRDRISVHYNGLGELHRRVEKSVLPKEYGGTGRSLEELIQYWTGELYRNRDWFRDDERYKAKDSVDVGVMLKNLVDK